MKRFTLLVLVLSTFLTACGKKDKKPSVYGRGHRGHVADDVRDGIPDDDTGGSGKSYEPTYGHYWGDITRGGYSQSDFTQSVEHFVSATMDPDNDLGYVSGDADQSTGIRFWGSVETSGDFNRNGTSSTSIRSSSAELRIVIWDSYAGQTDSEGNLITEIPVHVKGNASGTVKNNHATITWRQETDELGHIGDITLEGDFDANYFYGWVSYENARYWDDANPSGGGASGYLGYFVVRTCGFFRCD